MPYYREFFRTAAEAQSGVLTMVGSLRASYIAAASDAGSPMETTKPSTNTSVLASSDTPASGELKNVNWEISTPFGLKESIHSVMHQDQAPTPIAVSGKARFTKTTNTTIRVTSRIASRIRIQKLDTSGAIASGLTFCDPATGKRYSTTSGVTGGNPPGFYEVTVSEVTSSETGDVSFGTPMTCVLAPSNMNPYAQVSRMAGITINSGVTLTDAKGAVYTVDGGPWVLAESDSNLSGTHSISFVQVLGAIDGPTAVSVGTELTFATTPTNAKPIASVTSSPTAVVPVGTTFVRAGTPNRTMKTTASVTIGDSSSADVPFVATETTPFDPSLAVSSSMTVTPSVSGIENTATIVEVTPNKPFPVSYGSQLFGDEPSWKTIVKPTLDGRWVGIVYTDPLGT
jgi:hypothetical protein